MLNSETLNLIVQRLTLDGGVEGKSLLTVTP